MLMCNGVVWFFVVFTDYTSLAHCYRYCCVSERNICNRICYCYNICLSTHVAFVLHLYEPHLVSRSKKPKSLLQTSINKAEEVIQLCASL